MDQTMEKKIWILLQKNIKNIFFICLGLLAVSDFFIHRHHHFKLGEIHLFEAVAGLVFILILALLSIILKALFFKS